MGAHWRQELLGKASDCGFANRTQGHTVHWLGVSLYHGSKQSPRNQMFLSELENSATDTILKAWGPF